MRKPSPSGAIHWVSIKISRVSGWGQFRLTVRRPGNKGHLVERRVLSCGPVCELSGIDIAASHGVVHATNRAVLRLGVMNGEKQFAVLLGGEPVVHFGHFAIKVDQFGRLNARVRRLGIKLPANIVALRLAILTGLPARVGHGVLALGSEEPELVEVRRWLIPLGIWGL